MQTDGLITRIFSLRALRFSTIRTMDTLSCLVAYNLNPKKPAIRLNKIKNYIKHNVNNI